MFLWHNQGGNPISNRFEVVLPTVRDYFPTACPVKRKSRIF
jgi:hypothetical protein